MSGKILFVLIGLSLLSTNAYGTETEYEDVIYLKDGSVIRGLIVEEVPGETYKIEIAGGNILVFQAAEIDYVSRELKVAGEETPATGRAKEKPSSFYSAAGLYRPFLFGFNGVVGTYGAFGNSMLLYGGEFLAGWRLHPIYAVGLGFGYSRATYNNWDWDYGDETYNFIPIYVNNRLTYLRKDAIGLYGRFDLGYVLAYFDFYPGQHGDVLYGFGHGFEIGPPRLHLDFAVGLRNFYGNELITHFGFSM
jgi:hypothetical protein